MSMPGFRLFRALPVLLVALNFGCTGAESKPATDAPSAAEAAESPSARKTVLFLGTSLTAAQGLDPEQGFPAHIQEKIDSAGLPYEVVNAGQSGETSAGARSRIRWILEQPFDVLVLETGANDMLRGSDVDSLAANLQAVIDTVRSRRPDAAIVLAGMLATPNLGPSYVRRFDALYPEVARRNRLPLIPFILEGVAGESELNLADGVHPNARGQEVIAGTAWKTLEPILRQRAQAPAR
ncbi:MAG TPA: arylesterase [Longimicrobium sp.]|jgi:acyl-CoA thioesterase-1|nr:arylesterase [Longimicrobium sp.]